MTRLPPLHPAVAEVRVAVRRSLGRVLDEDRDADAPLVLVALSGGADSLALAAGVAFEAPRLSLRAGAVIIDHGLQPGSDGIAARAAEQAVSLGLDPVFVRRVDVAADDAAGPEGAAREARYAALEATRIEAGAAAIFTAHTLDDQAEQVLLALARGSGARAVAGIPPRRDEIHRPLLGVSRASTLAACEAQSLEPWHDPHNRDHSFARVRVRELLLPELEREIGPGIAANLARTAELAREDADALDALAAAFIAEEAPGPVILVDALAEQPAAVRGRAIRSLAAREFGTSLSREHTLAVASLVTDWRGQGPIHVPGGEVRREGGRLFFAAD